MGNIEDTRKAIQDFIAPDLKALAVRLEALEKEMNLRFEHVEQTMNARFEHVEQTMNARFEHVEQTMNVRFESVQAGFKHAEQMNQERFVALEKRQDTMMATMAANHASIMNVLEMEKRLARLESERGKAQAQHV